MNNYPANLNELIDWLETKGYKHDNGSLFDFIEDSIGLELTELIITKTQANYNKTKEGNSMKFEKMCSGALNIYDSVIKEDVDNIQVENYGIYKIRVGILDHKGIPLEARAGEMSEFNIDVSGDPWDKFTKLKEYMESEDVGGDHILGLREGEYTIYIEILDENGVPLPTNEDEINKVSIDVSGDPWDKFLSLKAYTETEEFDASNEVFDNIGGGL